MPGGRPTIYNQDIVSEICLRLTKGESLLRICKDENLPNRDTIYTWLLDNKHKEFSDNYAKARDIQADHMFDEILDIADDSTNDFMEKKLDTGVIEILNSENIGRSRLRVDSRKWYLSKVLPKKYGDKLDVETKHVGSITFKFEGKNGFMSDKEKENVE